ncbi:MAG: HDOD domain-containing protein [Pirellulales bacterium]
MNSEFDSVAPSELLPPRSDSAELMERLIRQAKTLYSLPTVAAEVLHLTSNPQIDVRALKECIALDPALTVKLLRVVNSSLFGLSREVGDLNQAIALLGIKPLKLLVLGFSLPDNLFSEVAHDQLAWYWQTALTRAVAARELSEQIWQIPGDDAFLAGLLQDIGVLVLLGELREPYARFLGRAITERFDVHRLQVESLGFDHTELSATLLEHWNMPQLLVQSIGEPRIFRRLQRVQGAHGKVAQILHLAELLSQLVGQNRLSVLPELLEAGLIYCEMDKDQLNDLVTGLQPKVDQLAEVLSLELPTGADYCQALLAAHAQMALLTEEIVQPPKSNTPYTETLADAQELRDSVQKFLQTPATSNQSSLIRGDADVPPRGSKRSEDVPETSAQAKPTITHRLINQLTLTVGQCRANRQGASIILLMAQGPENQGKAGQPTDFHRVIEQSLDIVCRRLDYEKYYIETCAPGCRLLVLSGCHRSEAVAISHTLLGQLQKLAGSLLSENRKDLSPQDCWNFSVGVASVGIPPKKFQASSLLDTAQRCLEAAQRTPGGSVKSLEIYY